MNMYLIYTDGIVSGYGVGGYFLLAFKSTSPQEYFSWSLYFVTAYRRY